jgi:hypothetical protein
VERRRNALSLAIFAALLLVNYNRYGLDGTESTSRWLSAMPFAGMFAHLRTQDAVFAFYYSVLHLWALGGHSVPCLRALSVLFALASLPVVYRIAAMLFDRSVAAWSVGALSTSFLFVTFATKVRGYSLEFFLCALAALFAVRIMQKTNERRDPWLFALWSILAIFAHPMAVAWVLMVGAAAVAFSDERARSALRLLAPSAAIALFAIVPLGIAAAVNRNGEQIEWIGPLTLGNLVWSLRYFTAGGSKAAVVVLAALFTIAVWRVTPSQRRNLYLVLFWLAGSIAVIILVSLKIDVIEPYYYLYAWIALSIVCGVALESLRASRFAYAAAALIAALALLNGYELAHNPWRHPDWRSAAAFLHGNVGASDAIVVHNAFHARPLYYALEEIGDERYFSELAYPREPFNDFTESPPPTLADHVARRYSSVWLVLRNDDIEHTPAVKALYGRYAHSDMRVFQGVRIAHLWGAAHHGSARTAERPAPGS